MMKMGFFAVRNWFVPLGLQASTVPPFVVIPISDPWSLLSPLTFHHSTIFFGSFNFLPIGHCAVVVDPTCTRSPGRCHSGCSFPQTVDNFPTWMCLHTTLVNRLVSSVTEGWCRLCFHPLVCLCARYLKMLWTDSDEIWWTGWVYDEDKLIRFWWRSISGSGHETFNKLLFTIKGKE